MNNASESTNVKQAYRPDDDYFIVYGRENFAFYVSRDMAQFIESRLDTRRVKWITFVDVFGSRVRIARDAIECVQECRAGQRASQRIFFRDRRLEGNSDPEWPDQA